MIRDLIFCQLCDEPIMPGDAVSQSTFDGKQVHHECGFRAVSGGVNHILGHCTCCGGTEPPDPPWLSKRDAARAALLAWTTIHGEGARGAAALERWRKLDER